MVDYLETKVDKFTFKVVTDRHYNSLGVWALAVGKHIRIGLSDFFQQSSGDVAFADVKPAGTVLAVGDAATEIETVKVTVAILSPLAGQIVKVNPLMENAPETINQDAYGEGWLCEIEPSAWESDLNNLMDPNAYFAQMKRQAEEAVNKNE